MTDKLTAEKKVKKRQKSAEEVRKEKEKEAAEEKKMVEDARNELLKPENIANV